VANSRAGWVPLADAHGADFIFPILPIRPMAPLADARGSDTERLPDSKETKDSKLQIPEAGWRAKLRLFAS